MKKIIGLFLVILSILGVFARSFAVLEIGQRNVFPKAECERLLTYNGVPIKTTYVAYIKDGVEYPAYCLDATIDGVGERGEYVVNGADKLRNIEVWRAIINGYPYKSLEELGAANRSGSLYGNETGSIYHDTSSRCSFLWTGKFRSGKKNLSNLL